MRVFEKHSIFFILTVAMFFLLSSLNYAEKKELRHVPNEAFGFGEELEYKVGYKFITAGYGKISIQKAPAIVDGRKAYDVRFQVSSLKSLEWVYRIRNRYRSLIDVSGIFPWEYWQQNREGNYKRDYNAKFDHYRNIAIRKDSAYDIPDYTHDIISAFFYVRTLDLKSMPNDTIFYLQNFVDDSTYQLGVKVHRRETIEVEAGKFKTIVIEPLVVEGGLFQSEGSIFIWLTDDDRKVPVKVATKIVIGYVGAELINYRGLRGPLKAKLE